MLVGRFIGKDPAEHQARVVDQAVEAAESGRRLGDDALAVGRAHDVAADGNRFAARGLDLLRHRPRRVLARVIADRDLGPLSGEPSREGRPDAGRASGDQDDPVGEIGDDEAGRGHMANLQETK